MLVTRRRWWTGLLSPIIHNAAGDVIPDQMKQVWNALFICLDHFSLDPWSWFFASRWRNAAIMRSLRFVGFAIDLRNDRKLTFLMMFGSAVKPRAQVAVNQISKFNNVEQTKTIGTRFLIAREAWCGCFQIANKLFRKVKKNPQKQNKIYNITCLITKRSSNKATSVTIFPFWRLNCGPFVGTAPIQRAMRCRRTVGKLLFNRREIK